MVATGAGPSGPVPRIMSIGDSVTYGFNDELAPNAGYRGILLSMLGYTPVGITDSNALGITGDLRWHHGFGGTGVNFLLTQLPTSLLDPHVGKIDICLIHEGTNSVAIGIDGDPAIGPRLVTACALISAANPACRFVIACPIINQGGWNSQQQADYATLNASVAASIPSIPGAVACTTMPTNLVNGVNIDGTHPRHAGYQLMANAWAGTLRSMGYFP
jgi:lysophospholipase L1-like esterase